MVTDFERFVSSLLSGASQGPMVPPAAGPVPSMPQNGQAQDNRFDQISRVASGMDPQVVDMVARAAAQSAVQDQQKGLGVDPRQAMMQQQANRSRMASVGPVPGASPVQFGQVPQVIPEGGQPGQQRPGAAQPGEGYVEVLMLHENGMPTGQTVLVPERYAGKLPPNAELMNPEKPRVISQEEAANVPHMLLENQPETIRDSFRPESEAVFHESQVGVEKPLTEAGVSPSVAPGSELTPEQHEQVREQYESQKPVDTDPVYTYTIEELGEINPAMAGVVQSTGATEYRTDQIPVIDPETGQTRMVTVDEAIAEDMYVPVEFFTDPSNPEMNKMVSEWKSSGILSIRESDLPWLYNPDESDPTKWALIPEHQRELIYNPYVEYPALTAQQIRETGGEQGPAIAAEMERQGVTEVPDGMMLVRHISDGRLENVPANEEGPPEGTEYLYWGGYRPQLYSEFEGSGSLGNALKFFGMLPVQAAFGAMSHLDKPRQAYVGNRGKDAYEWAKQDPETRGGYSGRNIGFGEGSILENVDPYNIWEHARAGDFILWANENPDLVIQAYEQGYTDEETGRTFTGGEAVWESFAHTRPTITRGIMDVLDDPLNVGSVGGGILRGAAKSVIGQGGRMSLQRYGVGRGLEAAGNVIDFADRIPGLIYQGLGGGRPRVGNLPGGGRFLDDVFPENTVAGQAIQNMDRTPLIESLRNIEIPGIGWKPLDAPLEVAHERAIRPVAEVFENLLATGGDRPRAEPVPQNVRNIPDSPQAPGGTGPRQPGPGVGPDGGPPPGVAPDVPGGTGPRQLPPVDTPSPQPGALARVPGAPIQDGLLVPMDRVILPGDTPLSRMDQAIYQNVSAGYMQPADVLDDLLNNVGPDGVLRPLSAAEVAKLTPVQRAVYDGLRQQQLATQRLAAQAQRPSSAPNVREGLERGLGRGVDEAKDRSTLNRLDAIMGQPQGRQISTTTGRIQTPDAPVSPLDDTPLARTPEAPLEPAPEIPYDPLRGTPLGDTPQPVFREGVEQAADAVPPGAAPEPTTPGVEPPARAVDTPADDVARYEAQIQTALEQNNLDAARDAFDTWASITTRTDDVSALSRAMHSGDIGRARQAWADFNATPEAPPARAAETAGSRQEVPEQRGLGAPDPVRQAAGPDPGAGRPEWSFATPDEDRVGSPRMRIVERALRDGEATPGAWTEFVDRHDARARQFLDEDQRLTNASRDERLAGERTGSDYQTTREQAINEAEYVLDLIDDFNTTIGARTGQRINPDDYAFKVPVDTGNRRDSYLIEHAVFGSGGDQRRAMGTLKSRARFGQHEADVYSRTLAARRRWETEVLRQQELPPTGPTRGPEPPPRSPGPETGPDPAPQAPEPQQPTQAEMPTTPETPTTVSGDAPTSGGIQTDQNGARYFVTDDGVEVGEVPIASLKRTRDLPQADLERLDLTDFQNRTEDFALPTVEDMTANYNPSSMKAIQVVRASDGNLYIFDGHSRVEAYRRMGRKNIRYETVEGTSAQRRAAGRIVNEANTGNTPIDIGRNIQRQLDDPDNTMDLTEIASSLKITARSGKPSREIAQQHLDIRLVEPDSDFGKFILNKDIPLNKARHIGKAMVDGRLGAAEADRFASQVANSDMTIADVNDYIQNLYRFKVENNIDPMNLGVASDRMEMATRQAQGIRTEMRPLKKKIDHLEGVRKQRVSEGLDGLDKADADRLAGYREEYDGLNRELTKADAEVTEAFYNPGGAAADAPEPSVSLDDLLKPMTETDAGKVSVTRQGLGIDAGPLEFQGGRRGTPGEALDENALLNQPEVSATQAMERSGSATLFGDDMPPLRSDSPAARGIDWSEGRLSDDAPGAKPVERNLRGVGPDGEIVEAYWNGFDQTWEAKIYKSDMEYVGGTTGSTRDEVQRWADNQLSPAETPGEATRNAVRSLFDTDETLGFALDPQARARRMYDSTLGREVEVPEIRNEWLVTDDTPITPRDRLWNEALGHTEAKALRGYRFENSETLLDRVRRYTDEVRAAEPDLAEQMVRVRAANRTFHDYNLDLLRKRDPKRAQVFEEEYARLMKAKDADQMEAQVMAMEKAMGRNRGANWYDTYLGLQRELKLYNPITGTRYMATQAVGNTITALLAMGLQKGIRVAGIALGRGELEASYAAVRNQKPKIDLMTELSPRTAMREMAQDPDLALSIADRSLLEHNIVSHADLSRLAREETMGLAQGVGGRTTKHTRFAELAYRLRLGHRQLPKTLTPQQAARARSDEIARTGRFTGWLSNEHIRDFSNAFDATYRTATWAHAKDVGLSEARDPFLRHMRDSLPDGADLRRFDELADSLPYDFGHTRVRDVFDEFGGGYAERMSRDWKNTFDKIDKAARKEVERFYFSGQETNLDAATRRVFMFHYWASRATPLYTEALMRNPGVLNAYLRMMDYADKEAESGKYGTAVKGLVRVFKTVLGYNIFIRPDALMQTVFNVVDDERFRQEDESLIWQFLDTVGLMPSPAIDAFLNLTGYQGSTTFTPDVLGMSTHFNFGSAIVDVVRSEMGLDISDPTQLGPETLLAKVRSRVSGVLPGSAKVELSDTAMYSRIEINQNILDVAEEQGYDWDDPADRALIIGAMEDPDSDLYRAAFRRYSYSNLAEWGMRFFPLTAVTYPRVRQAGADRRRHELRNATPGSDEQQTLRDQRDAATTLDPDARTLRVQSDEYQRLGTTEQQERYRQYNAIRFGDIGVIEVGGQQYTENQMRGMTADERSAVADAWAEENGYTEDIDTARELRKQYRETHPEYAAYYDWSMRVRDYDGGPVKYWEDLRRDERNPNAERWYRNRFDEDMPLRRLEQELTGLQAYMAWTGFQASGYDPLPISTNAGNAPYDPSGGPRQQTWGSGGSQTQADPAKAIAQDIADYRQEAAEIDAMLAERFGEGTTWQHIENANPTLQAALLQHMQTAGIPKPSLSRRAQEYLEWAESQEAGTDTSIDAYLRWKESFEVSSPEVPDGAGSLSLDELLGILNQ